MFKINKNKAFSLAEVLITLGIIGIIFALVMPMLNNENRIHQLMKIDRHKVYNELYQSIGLVALDEHSLDNISESADASTVNKDFMKLLIPKLSSIEEINNGSFAEKCWPSVASLDKIYNQIEAAIGKDIPAYPYGAILSKGSLVGGVYHNACDWKFQGSTDICGFVIADINGYKKPNAVAYDNGDPSDQIIIPFGIKGVPDGFNPACPFFCNNNCQRYNQNCTKCEAVPGCI